MSSYQDQRRRWEKRVNAARSIQYTPDDVHIYAEELAFATKGLRVIVNRVQVNTDDTLGVSWADPMTERWTDFDPQVWVLLGHPVREAFRLAFCTAAGIEASK